MRKACCGYLVFLCCGAPGVTSLLDMGKPYVLGTGGVHAIFVSQSNDFALGLPIFLVSDAPVQQQAPVPQPSARYEVVSARCH